ncbi:MAG TPA: 6-phosphogluconolactonase [Thermoanaerobaculia bacterium]|nr:6-phosphogluconolactonase [Thermoanaerobaculia bacterium]
MTKVRVLDDTAALARAAAEEVVRAAVDAVRKSGRFTIALSGGSTPRALYRLLASDGFRDRLPWNAIHFFWGDERHVPPDHPESNFRMVREAMLDLVPVPPGNVHRIRAEEEAERAAVEYEEDLRSFFALSPGEWPRFDLVLMGLGPEGHTASLFPGSPAISENERLVVAPWVEAHHTFRITMTPPVFNHAAEVLFLVSGGDKAPAVHAVIEGERDPALYPAQVVQGNVLWMVDRAAARNLVSAV